ncbi:MAG: DHH family phosphoesterase [Clostridiaceae bacterium]|nr:DHH family phosphoesterase [Clostridiaceae bacterium]
MSEHYLSPEEAAQRLQTYDRVLVLTHKRPDGDTIGSASALIQGLRAQGKTAYACENPEVTPRYEPYLVPYYPPKGFTPDVIVATDIAAASLLPDTMRKYADSVALAIDHHGASRDFAREICVEPTFAACGELIYTILGLMDVTINASIADALYTAISTDTGCFRYSNTTAQTHRIIAALMDAGCQAAYLNQILFEIRTPARVAIESAVLRDIVYYASGAVAVAKVSRELVARTGATEDDMESLSSLARRIEGVRIGVTLYERREGIKVSVRTDETVDASAICARFGGGGHPRAAGCTLAGAEMTLEGASRTIRGAIFEMIEDLKWTDGDRL